MVSTGRGAQDKYMGWKELTSQFQAKHEAFHTKATSFRSEATPLKAVSQPSQCCGSAERHSKREVCQCRTCSL